MIMKKTRKYDIDMEYHVWVRSLYMTLPIYEKNEDYDRWYSSWEFVLESIYFENSKTEQNATIES